MTLTWLYDWPMIFYYT